MCRRWVWLGGVLALCWVCFVAGVAHAQTDIARSLNKEQQRAREREAQLKRLSQQEVRVVKDVQTIEKRIRNLTGSVAKHEKELAKLEAALQAAEGKLGALTKRAKAVQRDLDSLLEMLWPLYIRRDSSGVFGESASRDYAWTKSLYEDVDARQRELAEQHAAIKKALAQKETLTQAARERLEVVNGDKNKLLQDKLRYRRKLQAIKRDKANAEEELRAVLGLIRTLNFKLEDRGGQQEITALKGRLPWPVQGEVRLPYRPKGSPPVRGLGLRVRGALPVKAVAWGKVMHNDVLRGFGRVVILMHGTDYYSLYAYLSESSVKVGKNIKQGEVIGTTGYYPDVDGDGLYFELRFHQKAINPEQWLLGAK